MKKVEKDFSRRDFIKVTSSVAVSYLAANHIFAQAQVQTPADSTPAPAATVAAGNDDRLGYWIGSSVEGAGDLNKKYKKKNNLFYIYDMDKKVHSETEVEIGLSHDTVFNPNHPYRVLIVENQGPYAVEFDLLEKRATRRYTASPGHLLIGHATYSPDGSKLYMGQYPIGRMDLGTMLVLEEATGKHIKTLSSGGVLPVEFAWLPDKRTMAIGNYGLPGHYVPSDLRSNLTIYDSVEEKVVDVIPPPSPNLYLCHVKAGTDGRLFVITHNMLSHRGKKFDEIRQMKTEYEKFIRTRPMFLDFYEEPSPILALEKDKNGKYQYKYQHTADGYRWGLSVVINEKYGVVGGTHGLGKTVTFQDYGTGKLIAEHTFKDEDPRSMAITMNGRYFVVSATSGSLHYFDAKTRELAFSEIPKANRYKHVIHSKALYLPG